MTFPSDGDSETLRGPLDGVRVLDLTRVLSGPHAARMLCDLGADVIKVEPPDGDLTRFSNPRVGGMATYFVQQNVGKRNVSLDMSKPEGVALLLDLASRSDVLLENFRPGVMDRMGLGYEAVHAVNPRIVYGSVNGYGSTGPWRARRAYAPVIGAESGFTKAQADAVGGPYVNDAHSHADVYTAMEMAAGILAALYRRERTGRGQHIEVAMAQTMLYVNEHTHDHLFDDDHADAVSADWIRSFQPADYPVLTAANGDVVIVSGHPAERGTFERFVRALADPAALDDPRFATVHDRLAHLDEIHRLLRAGAALRPDAATLEADLDAQGLAMGELRSVRDMAASEWAAERNAIVEVDDRSGGTVRIPNSPWRFSEARTGVHGVPRFRGEDNEAVLRDVLGLDGEAIGHLQSAGVLSSRLPKHAVDGSG